MNSFFVTELPSTRLLPQPSPGSPCHSSHRGHLDLHYSEEMEKADRVQHQTQLTLLRDQC